MSEAKAEFGGSTYERDRNQMLVECARLLGARISWADKLEIVKAMREIRRDARSMMDEDAHLMDAMNLNSNISCATIGDPQ